jgi:hypothetical protein
MMHTKRYRRLCAAIAWVLVLVVLVYAVPGAVAAVQSLGVAWWTIGGGGGTSAGATYSVSGTIGQYNAATVSGASVTVAGGFWPGLSASPVDDGPEPVRVYVPLVLR